MQNMELKEIANEILKFMDTFVTNFLTPLCVCTFLGIVTYLAQKWSQKRVKIHNRVKEHTSYDICTTHTELSERIDAEAKYIPVETVHVASKLVDDNLSGCFEETTIYNRQTVEEMTEIALNENYQYNSTKTEKSFINSEIKSSETKPVVLNEKFDMDIRRKPEEIDIKIKDNHEDCSSVSETNKLETDLSALIEKSEIDFGRKLENTEITIIENQQDCTTEIVSNIKKEATIIVASIEKSIENQFNKQFEIKCLKDRGSENKIQCEYETKCRELIKGMKKLYNDNLSNVPLSQLNDNVDEKLRDVFISPKICKMRRGKRAFEKTDKPVTQYKDVFLTDDTENRRIFLQGETGSGKTTFLAKMALDWCKESHMCSAKGNISHIFADLDVVQGFMFVFHITLKHSVKQFDVNTMIKKQIIDSIYAREDRKKAYILVNEIMKRERCLVLLDGLDEWTGPGDHHNLPTLVVDHSKCVMLFSTRPWTLAVGKIKHSEIGALLQLEGINKPFEFSRILLSRRVSKEDLNIKYAAFKHYIENQKLEKLLSSPMFLSTIVCSYADGIELNGSKCELYILLLESLFKKANLETRRFEQPPFPCFTGTKYIQPNIEHMNRLAELAFNLLFENAKENSLVFSNTELENFALTSGIVSATHNAFTVRSASFYMFIHFSIQEFLAAYHIARNTNLIDGVISVYLNRHKDANRDIAEVFTFMCGLEVVGAERLSSMMNERNALNDDSSCVFCDIIQEGYREAVANGHTNMSPKLSHFYIDMLNMKDLQSIWANNTANALSLCVDNDMETYANDDSASNMKIDLSLCSKLKILTLKGNGILIKDAVSVAISERPVWIALRITDPTQYSGNSPELPSIQQIELTDVTCSYTWLCSLLSMLLTLDHKVKCSLNDCEITSDVGGAVSPLFKTGHLEIQTENTKIALSVRNTSLWEALHGLNIKSLRLEGRYKAFRENHKELIDQTLSLLFKLDTLRITEEHDTPDLWQTLHGLNIKILSLSIVGRIKHTESLAQSLASLKQLDMLSIEVNYDRRGLWEALHGLSIKSLSMRLICKDGCFKLNYAESMKQSLSSLTQLETLIVSVTYYIPGLWGSLYGLNIKRLILNGGWRGLSLEHAESLSQSLSSHKHLIILSIELDYDRPELWDALNGLSMKRLSLSGKRRGLKLLYAESMKKSLLSLKQLESLIISGFEDCPGLWEAFSGLSIRHLSLLAGLGSYRVDHNGASKSLLSLTHLETLIISEDDKSPGVWQALRFLNIKSLSLYGCNDRGFRVNDTTSLSQSLSSLTHLEKLTLYVFASIGLQLPQSLKYLNIYCETMPPSKLRDILDTLSACKHAIEIRLECGCASSVDPPERVQLQEYHSSQLEIAARNNVAIKRFRIYEWHYSAGSDMYIHNVCDVDDASQDDCSVEDDAYEHFAKRMKDLKFSRISIRLQTPVAK